MNAVVRWFAAATIVSVAGCTSLETVTGPGAEPSFEARRTQLQDITHWEMRGRIAIDTGTQARQGRFTWWQEDAALRLIIRGPLGAGAVEIRSDGETLSIRTRRETRVLSDPETELSELLGWWLPITSLPSWLLGTPDARYADPAAVIEAGLLRHLEQRSWALRFEEYANHGEYAIPATITLAHAPLELIVTIDDWQPQTALDLELDAGRRAQ